MVSKCCHAVIYTACSHAFVQLYDNWYECSRCSRPCDIVFKEKYSRNDNV